MDARMSLIAGALVATAAFPLAAAAADTPAATARTPAVAAAATAATTPQACPGDMGLTPLERRLLAKYDQDPMAMLGFVWITRPIYLLDRRETLQWAEAYRKTHPC